MEDQARMPGGPERARRRPTRPEIEPAALELVQRYGPQIMGVARRFSSTPEDAEDAYQRALEILLTKAPTTDEAELLPWVKTVVKHEAFALGRHRGRVALGSEDSIDGDSDRDATPPPTPAEQAERLEQLAVGAEALNGLKPHEIRALRLLAEGHTYREIQEITGWT